MAGIAVTAAVAPYPNICYSGCIIGDFWYSYGISAHNIGLVWMTEPDVTTLATAANPMSALMRALGATSRQVSAGLAAAQVLSALPGAIVGVPLGIALVRVLSKATVVGNPSVLGLVATVIGTLIVVAGLTTIPARIAARVPPPEVLAAGAD